VNKRLSVLVIDDEEGIVEFLKQWLEAQGHRVTGETNPRLALRKIAINAYDVVLLDLIMPDANGLSMISEIRRLRPEAAVIVISAIVDARLAVVAMKEGGMDCLPKPINLPDLERTLKSIQRTAFSVPITIS